jgi:ABC-type Fe3+/spermidine/putrescine transport system ATPase subunit
VRRPDADVPAVVFDRVSLAFDDNVVLREISFTVRAGSMTILIGASGSGKSVVLTFLSGWVPPLVG